MGNGIRTLAVGHTVQLKHNAGETKKPEDLSPPVPVQFKVVVNNIS